MNLEQRKLKLIARIIQTKDLRVIQILEQLLDLHAEKAPLGHLPDALLDWLGRDSSASTTNPSTQDMQRSIDDFFQPPQEK